MSVNGEKFLELNREETLYISKHAKERLWQFTDFWLNEEDATKVFMNAQQITHEEVMMLGYRPSYSRRKNKGVQTWYFRTMVNESEVIIVVTRAEDNKMLWITTFVQDKQNRLLASSDYACLSA